MKKMLISWSLLILLLFTGCFLNTAENVQLEKRDGIVYRVGENKPFTGTMKSFHSNGKLAVIEKFKNGKNNGKVKKYYEDGSLSTEYSYKNGSLHGKYVDFYENGKLQREIEFKNGKKHGIVRCGMMLPECCCG